MFGASICWMGHLFSISNPTCLASRPKSYAVGGWPKLRHDRSDDVAVARHAESGRRLQQGAKSKSGLLQIILSQYARRLIRCARSPVVRRRVPCHGLTSARGAHLLAMSWSQDG